MNKQVRLITALALGAAVLSLPAVATAQLTVDIVDPAPLVGRGAGAIVSVEVTCDFFGPATSTFLTVNLNQRFGKSVSGGSGFAQSFNCSSTPRTLEVLVTSFNTRFKSGSAIAQAFLNACAPDFSVCDNAEAAEEIRLIK